MQHYFFKTIYYMGLLIVTNCYKIVVIYYEIYNFLYFGNEKLIVIAKNSIIDILEYKKGGIANEETLDQYNVSGGYG